MATPPPEEITQLLLAWNQGEQAALERLMPLVYEELRRLAHRYMERERGGHALQTTPLVNEAYLRLIDASRVEWQNRAHFFAISDQLMRRNLRRGGEAERVSLDEALTVAAGHGAEMVALDDALNTLAALNARQSQVVEMHFFGGLSVEEIAEVLNVSVPTVRRDWRLARAWLYRELSK